MSALHTCPSCTAEYTSPLAAAECEEADRMADLNTRQWFKRR